MIVNANLKRKIYFLLLVSITVLLLLPVSEPAYAETQDDYTYYFITGGVKIIAYSGVGGDLVIPDKLGGQPVLEIGDSAFKNKLITSVVIPDSVKLIGPSAFESNQLSLLIIPDSVTSIETKAFYNNTLGYMVIGNSVTAIGSYAFQNNRLTSITIPNSVTSIDDYAFSENQLTSVIIPDSVNKLGNSAFYNNNLTSVTISNNVSTIGFGVFSVNQLTSVIIPDSVTTIGSMAFSNNQLANVTLGNRVTTINYAAFYHNKLTSITIPDSVTSIGYSAFNNNQLTNVIIGKCVTTIDNYAFTENQLTSITIPDSITTIGIGAFDSNKLTSITIPDSVTSIDDYAFYNNELTSVTIHRKNISLGINLFVNNPSNLTLYGIAGSSVETYAIDNGYQFIAIPSTLYSININPAVNGTITSNKTEVELDEGVLLTITPDSGYVLDTLKLNGDIKSAQQNLYFFYMPRENVIVDATFKSTNEKAITSFIFAGLNPQVVGNINESAKTIALTVPQSTDLTALTPTIEYIGNSISPSSGVAQNFTDPITYTVTALDGSTAVYVVSVIKEASALIGLSIKEGSDGVGQELISSFDANSLSYSVQVAQEMESVQIGVTPAPNTTARIYLGDLELADGIIPLTEGMNTVNVVVSETDKADRTYIITIQRGAVDECFIATAAFGSKFEPAVVLLRHFRDEYLLTNKFGTAFVNFYYHNSPPIAAYIADNNFLKGIVRALLVPIIGLVYSIYHPIMFWTLLLFLALMLIMYRRYSKQHSDVCN